MQVIEEHGIGIGIGVWEDHPRMKTAEMFLSINPLANIGCLLDSQPMGRRWIGYILDDQGRIVGQAMRTG